MTRRIDRNAERLSYRLQRASEIIPEIRDHLHEQRTHIRTIGAAGTDEGRTGGGHSDPTLRAVMERDRVDYLEGCIDDALASIHVGINLLDTYCRDALGYRREVEPERARQSMCCDNQQGKHGVDEWGDPLCPMPSVKQGLCQSHYDAWRYRRIRDGISVERDYGQAS